MRAAVNEYVVLFRLRFVYAFIVAYGLNVNIYNYNIKVLFRLIFLYTFIVAYGLNVNIYDYNMKVLFRLIFVVHIYSCIWSECQYI